MVRYCICYSQLLLQLLYIQLNGNTYLPIIPSNLHVLNGSYQHRQFVLKVWKLVNVCIFLFAIMHILVRQQMLLSGVVARQILSTLWLGPISIWCYHNICSIRLYTTESAITQQQYNMKLRIYTVLVTILYRHSYFVGIITIWHGSNH